MIQKIENYCKQNEIIKTGDRILIGLSGGADSVCLFFVLLDLKENYHLSLQAVHIHHGLRGQEADRDASFVKELCSRYQIPCILKYYDIASEAKKQGVSEEEAGRNIRYAAMEQIRKELGYTKIAVAHHAGDQAETILFHLCRGSGLAGLTGMRPVSGYLIRPLLRVSRKEIENYLKERGQPWCEDTTNLENQYSRNRLRNQVFPLLTAQINAETTEHIVAAGEMIKEAYDYIREEAEQKKEKLVRWEQKTGEQRLDTEGILSLSPVLRKEIYRLLLKETGGLCDITAYHLEQLDELVKGQVGRKIDLPGEREAQKTYQSVLFFKKGSKEICFLADWLKDSILLRPGESYPLFPGKTLMVGIPEEIHQFCLKRGLKREKIMEENHYTKCFDYDKIKDTLKLRTRQKGDYLKLGNGYETKMLKKYFIDQKIMREERERIPLIADGSHILWVIGYRISAGFKITDATRTILQIKINGGQEDDRTDPCIAGRERSSSDD